MRLVKSGLRQFLIDGTTFACLCVCAQIKTVQRTGMRLFSMLRCVWERIRSSRLFRRCFTGQVINDTLYSCCGHLACLSRSFAAYHEIADLSLL